MSPRINGIRDEGQGLERQTSNESRHHIQNCHQGGLRPADSAIEAPFEMQEHRKTPRADARALMCIWVACAVGFALFVENIIGWFLFFSPGWADPLSLWIELSNGVIHRSH